VTHPPTADDVTAHTLLNCLVREVSGPEDQTSVVDEHLLLRLPRRDLLLRVALRRVVQAGPHRFTGPVSAWQGGRWVLLGWRELAEAVRDELTLRTGVPNSEFVAQVVASHAAVEALLAARADLLTNVRKQKPRSGRGEGRGDSFTNVRSADFAASGEADARFDTYIASEQSLVFGHRHHPTPKAGPGATADWLRHAPEAGARFRLHHLAVRRDAVAQAGVRGLERLDLVPVPDGYLPLPVHPWQLGLLARDPALCAALADGRVLDLGPGGPEVVPTASVRTVYHPGVDAFLKFSLGVRITNCVRKNSAYELAGAVALTGLLPPVVADLRDRFPGVTVLAEPAYRSVAGDLLEGLGVIVRDSLRPHLADGVTPLLAAALADEHSGLLDSVLRDPVDWFDAYLRLLVPPVLHAYFAHGVVFEPHLQNVVVGVDRAGLPAQLFLRDLEGVKLVESAHWEPPPGLQVSYDAERGWNRVVYCLLVNHVAEVLAAVADRHPGAEPVLWELVRARLADHRRTHGDSPQLRALLSGVPLPAKANLLTRWQRHADRQADYVPMPNPWGPPPLPAAAAR
jgi:siderophore synthetase component